MPRRKPNQRPDPTERITLEETQEMWTVGGPGTPEVAPEPESGTGTDEPRAGRKRDPEGPTAGGPEAGIDSEAETAVVTGDDEWSWQEVAESEPDDSPVEADEWEEDPADDPDEGWYEDEEPEDVGKGPVSVWREEEEPNDSGEESTEEWQDEGHDDVANDPTDEWAEDGQAAASPGPAAPPRRSIGDRLSALNLPDIPDPDPRNLLAAVAVAAVALAVGYGTYELGKGSGEDIDAARIRGEAAGREAGAAEGAARGYAAGFQKGREKGFARTYRETYRIHYKRAFEQAGLDVPKDKDIDVPAP